MSDTQYVVNDKCVPIDKCVLFLLYQQCQTEIHKIPLFDADLFIGIERKNIDVKNPLPTKYPICLLVRVKDNNRFLCADSAEDRLLISAAVIFAQVCSHSLSPFVRMKKHALMTMGINWNL